MASCLLVVLIVVSLSMIIWGLWDRDRLYQYPTLAGVAWLGFIVPQAVGVMNNGRSVPSRVLSENGLELALLMSIACAMASFIGYVQGGRRPLPSRPPSLYSPDRLFVGGLVLYALAFLAFHQLAQMAGGYLDFFSVEGAYRLRWTGLTVVYAFFTKLIYPGLLLTLIAALHSGTILKWLCVCVGCILPSGYVFLLGRRQDAIAVVLIVGVTVFLTRRWCPPRPFAVIGMILGAIMIVVAPYYRISSQLGGDLRQIREINVSRRMMDRFEGHETLEFENAVVQMPAVRRSGFYGLGGGFYNRTIKSMVPRLIVGDEVKEGLLMRTPDHRDLTWRFYRWKTKHGTYSTGVCDVFREFGFLGPIVFFAIGFTFRRLWEHAYIRKSTPASLFYILTCIISMTSVVNNVGEIPSQLIFLVAFLTPILFLARVGTSKQAAFPGAGHLKRLPSTCAT